MRAPARVSGLLGLVLVAAGFVACGANPAGRDAPTPAAEASSPAPGPGSPPPAPGPGSSRAQRYWLGSTFAGLPLTHEAQGLIVYGSCRPPAGQEGGCSPPLQLQFGSICSIHPLRYDGIAAVPDRRYRMRGALAADYGGADGHTDLYTAETAVRIFAEPGIDTRDVIAALRPFPRPARRRQLLAPPAFPATMLMELRQVRRTHRQLGNVAAVRRELHLAQSIVRDRLDLERDIRSLEAPGPTRCQTAPGTSLLLSERTPLVPMAR